MKEMNLGMLNKMMKQLIVAIEEQICYPRNISVMQLFSIWANMERIDA